MTQQVISGKKPRSVSCKKIAKLGSDYSSCMITYDDNATVSLKGASGGKFSNLKCAGTKDNMTCVELDPNEPDCVYAYGSISSASEGQENFLYVRTNNGDESPVFIRYNKTNLNEKYACTTYKMVNNEPRCVSATTYSARNNENSEWSSILDLFGSSNCGETGSGTYCNVNDPIHYNCHSNSTFAGCWGGDFCCNVYTSGIVDYFEM